MADDLAEELGQNIPLSEMIKTLRRELQLAMTDSSGSPLRFRAEKVELELEIALSNERHAGGKVKFWVLTAEGALKKGGARSHKFKLTLVPETLQGDTAYVADESKRPPS